jgi:GT2 family glycosyltransferase
MGFSIIIPVKALAGHVLATVPVTLRLAYEDFEIIVLPNELPEGGVPAPLVHPKVRVIPSGKVSPAVKRDQGAAAARYETLAFLDDDAYPRADWLTVAERAMAESGAAAVCGPGVTPPSSTLSQIASGIFYETVVGGGGMAYRYRPGAKSFYVDDFPTVNLIVQKAAFLKVGGFDNAFWPGEDTKFCLDFVNAGYRILYLPELVVWHHRRSLMLPHLKQVGGYGRHRGYFAKRFPKTSARPTYFAPSVFLLGNLALLALALGNPAWWSVWAALLALYLTIATVDVVLRTRHPLVVVMAVAAILASHLTYGAMFIKGLLSPSTFKSQLR